MPLLLLYIVYKTHIRWKSGEAKNQDINPEKTPIDSTKLMITKSVRCGARSCVDLSRQKDRVICHIARRGRERAVKASG